MFALIIIGIAGLFNEIGTSLGKVEERRHEEGIYTMGFLNLFWGGVFILLLGLLIPTNFFALGFPAGFVFSLDSLPTFLPRVLLEIVQLHLTLLAIVYADRSTSGFLSVLTLPLLLSVDVALGYSVDFWQIGGITLIVGSLIMLFINHGIRKAGALFVFLSAINAVITMSLYKYNITHFNSVEAEQGIMITVLLVYAWMLARIRTGENPLKFLIHPIFFFQSVTKGLSVVLVSFAYLFGAASVITAGKRSFTILWSVLVGNVYFHEKHIGIQMTAFILIISGIILLIL